MGKMAKKILKYGKKYIKMILRRIVKYKISKKLKNKEKESCMLHSDWEPLTREELKNINRTGLSSKVCK